MATPQSISQHQMVLLVQQQRTAQGILDPAVQHEQQLDAELLMICFSELVRHAAGARQLCSMHPGTTSLLSACQRVPLSPAQAVSIAPAAAALKLRLPPTLLDRLMALASSKKLLLWDAVRGLGAFAALDSRPSRLQLNALVLQTVVRAHVDARMLRAALSRMAKRSKRPDQMLLAGVQSQGKSASPLLTIQVCHGHTASMPHTMPSPAILPACLFYKRAPQAVDAKGHSCMQTFLAGFHCLCPCKETACVICMLCSNTACCLCLDSISIKCSISPVFSLHVPCPSG